MKTYQIVLIISFFIVMVFAIMLYGFYVEKKAFKESYNLYKENCPKLGAYLYEENIDIFNYPKCFKEVNHEIKFYYITKINGELFLKEIGV